MDVEVATLQIMAILLPLTEEQRTEVLSNIRHNEIFCVDCGSGSFEHPNPRCYCTKDE